MGLRRSAANVNYAMLEQGCVVWSPQEVDNVNRRQLRAAAAAAKAEAKAKAKGTAGGPDADAGAFRG